MEIGPILRALGRNKIGATLIGLQIAFTMTVIINAAFLIADRMERANRPSGVAESELFHVASRGFTKDYPAKANNAADLALLRAVPGVVDATAINAIPLSGSGWSTGLRLEPGDDKQRFAVAVYMVDEYGLDTFGTKLVAGRGFTVADTRERTSGTSDWPDKGIISEATAQAMWPAEAASAIVGRTAYIGDSEPITIIGIVERLQAPWTGASFVEQSLVVPDRLVSSAPQYLVRTQPGRRDELMPVVEEALARANGDRIVHAPESMAETREKGYKLDMGLANVLGTIMALLVVITSLGIVGLASFSVRRRTKEIGTRRALGATKGDILRYFLVENFLITTVGVVLGAVMTVGFNTFLVGAFGFPKVGPMYLPIGMAVLWIIGLLAVLGPALRASNVPPAVATRTV